MISLMGMSDQKTLLCVLVEDLEREHSCCLIGMTCWIRDIMGIFKCRFCT